MLLRLALLALVCVACASTRDGPRVAVSAAAEGDDVRVRFRRLRGGTGDWKPKVTAEQGDVVEVIHSYDRLTASALWRNRAGGIRCAFAYGGVGTWSAASTPETDVVRYVFFEEPGWRVTAEVPAGCPVRPHLDLVVEAAGEATFTLPGGKSMTLAKGANRVRWELPRFDRGVLATGDFVLVLEHAQGRRPVVVTIDSDGTPAATLGYLENW